MKKKFLFLFLLTALIAGCTNPVENSSTSTNDTTDFTSDSSNSHSASDTTPTTSSSDEPTSTIPEPDTSTGGDSTSLPIDEVISISEANARGANISVDKDGNGRSTEIISFNGAFASIYVDGTKFDRIALFTDGVDYIYVRVAESQYGSYMIGKTYRISGKLTKYYHHLEMDISSTWTLTTPNISYDIKSLAVEYTLSELNNIAESLKPRDKGAIFTEIIKLTARYVAKTDNTKMLMYDGHNVISVHGDNKINNQFSLGNIYTIYGIVGKYTGMPSVEFIDKEFVSLGSMDDVDYDAGEITDVDLSHIYKNRPDSWESPYFPYVLRATVYVDVDKRATAGKISKPNDYAIADNYLLKLTVNGRYKWDSNTSFAEAVRVQNSDDMFYLDGSSKGESILLDAYLTNTPIELTFVIYQYLSGPHLWSVHLLGDLFVEYE